MAEQFDPRDVRILSDILALVLDDQLGQAAGALETLRTRAKRNNLTGGALKNLFNTLVTDDRCRNPSARLRQLENERDTLAREFGRLEARIRALQSQLTQSQRDSQALHDEAALTRSQQNWRLVTIAIALIAGILLGTAATSVFHTVTDHPRCDRAIYLH